MISQRNAGRLLESGGPRYYFETNSAQGARSNLDHPIWRRRGIRFDVHLDVRFKTPALHYRNRQWNNRRLWRR